MPPLYGRNPRECVDLPGLRRDTRRLGSIRRELATDLDLSARSRYLIAFAGIALGTWIASVDERTTFFDGMIAFLLLSPFMLFFASVGLVMRYVIPKLRESWYR